MHTRTHILTNTDHTRHTGLTFETFWQGMRYQMIMKHFTLALALGSALPLSYWLITLLCAATYW